MPLLNVLVEVSNPVFVKLTELDVFLEYGGAPGDLD